MSVNAELVTNANGLRLITDFEGAPRLKARLCEGGRYELSYGVTFHLDGSPVLEGETCTEEQAIEMFRNALKVFERIVQKYVTAPLNGNQFSALVAFSYNVGEENFKSSTVLRMVNDLRFEDAAAAFGMWVFATKDGYKQALRGLLRREYATSCLFLSYDWTEACADEAIALQRQKPDKLPGADRVLYKTPFSSVLRVAQKFPLPPEPTVTIITDKPAAIEDPLVLENIVVDKLPEQASAEMATSEVAVRETVETSQPLPSLPASLESAESKGGSDVAAAANASGAAEVEKPSPLPQLKPVQTPPIAGDLKPLPIPKPESKWSVPITDAPYRIDPTFGLKPMEETQRWQASLAQNGGITFMRIARYGGFGSGPATVATYIEKDPLFSAAFMALLAFAGIFIFGYVRKCYGDWMRHHAESKASQAMV